MADGSGSEIQRDILFGGRGVSSMGMGGRLKYGLPKSAEK